jgi:dipeptidyl aminopeptidase/acylaminoacyl peptidase
MKKRIPFLFTLVITLAIAVSAQFGVADLLNLKRVTDPQLSPDGRSVAYTVGTVDKAANRVVNQIWVVGADGRNARQLTTGTSSASSPRWSPDGKKLAYVTGGQIWKMDGDDGGDKEQVTQLSSGASQPIWSPDGRWIAFLSDVYPECQNDACNKVEDEKAEASKVKAKVTDRLLFKHWNEWRDRKRTHTFIVPSNGGTARDMTPGDFDSPPYGGATGVDMAFSPDGRYFVWLKNPDKVEAVSTNSDLYMTDLQANTTRHITSTMKGYDTSPVFTPDGKYLLFLSMATPTFEADRNRIMRYNMANGEIVELTKGFDLQAHDLVVSPDSKTAYFTAEERGRKPIFSVPVEPDFRLRPATHVKKVADAGYTSALSTDGRSIVYLSSTAATAAEIFRVGTDGTGTTAITTINGAQLASARLQKAEDVNWKGAMNTPVHGFLVKPANFDPARKYPLIVLIHGGPQGAFNDNWGYRWNPQVWANQGYIVFMPNFRGSTGYGQKFTNDISADWGGKAFVDLSNGVAEVIKRPFIDKNRIGAAGASYGGYMVDWLLGHNNDPRFKYKAFLSHAGVYNLESMATSTEEIWFVNWEFKGMPWENPVHYNRWSPHKFAKNFNTPTLVTHGELDFRVPYDQSLQLYTTLQLKGVPSKLIMFPDEGHWILKPQNSEFWHNQVFDWFRTYLKP